MRAFVCLLICVRGGGTTLQVKSKGFDAPRPQRKVELGNGPERRQHLQLFLLV